MKTITIQIKNKKAYKILRDLEELDVIKLIPSEKKNLSEKYSGVISSETADDLNNYVNESRKEWGERDI